MQTIKYVFAAFVCIGLYIVFSIRSVDEFGVIRDLFGLRVFEGSLRVISPHFWASMLAWAPVVGVMWLLGVKKG